MAGLSGGGTPRALRSGSGGEGVRKILL